MVHHINLYPSNPGDKPFPGTLKIKKLKWQWAGHIRRRNDTFNGKEGTRSEAANSQMQCLQPMAHCTDDVKRVAGSGRMRTA